MRRCTFPLRVDCSPIARALPTTNEVCQFLYLVPHCTLSLKLTIVFIAGNIEKGECSNQVRNGDQQGRLRCIVGRCFFSTFCGKLLRRLCLSFRFVCPPSRANKLRPALGKSRITSELYRETQPQPLSALRRPHIPACGCTYKILFHH